MVDSDGVHSHGLHQVDIQSTLIEVYQWIFRRGLVCDTWRMLIVSSQCQWRDYCAKGNTGAIAVGSIFCWLVGEDDLLCTIGCQKTPLTIHVKPTLGSLELKDVTMELTFVEKLLSITCE